MAFSFGNLLATAASARAGARRGQREQQQLDAEAERQSRLDQFNEYARSRQLAQTDNAQDQRKYIEDEKRRTDWEKAQLLADVNKFRANAQYGPEGSVDRTNASRSGDVRATNASRETVADKNNAGQLQRVLITVDGANRRDNTIVTLPDGGMGLVDANGRVTPFQGTPYEKPTTQGSRVSAAVQKRRDAQRQAIIELEAALGAVESANAKKVAWAGPADARWGAFRQGVMQREDNDASPAQRAYQRITSKEINDLFGAALSAREDVRTTFQLPNLTAVNEASAQAILAERLAILRKIAAEDPGDEAPSGSGRFGKPPQRP